VVLLLFMAGDGNRQGYRHLLDSFWDECATHGVPLPTQEPVGAASKMESAFRGASRWNDRRVFAVDAVATRLARSREQDGIRVPRRLALE